MIRHPSRPSFVPQRRLDIIELDGFLPCMVFERGDMTLNEWREKLVRDIDAKRSVVHQVRQQGPPLTSSVPVTDLEMSREFAQEKCCSL